MDDFSYKPASQGNPFDSDYHERPENHAKDPSRSIPKDPSKSIQKASGKTSTPSSTNVVEKTSQLKANISEHAGEGSKKIRKAATDVRDAVTGKVKEFKKYVGRKTGLNIGEDWTNHSKWGYKLKEKIEDTATAAEEKVKESVGKLKKAITKKKNDIK